MPQTDVLTQGAGALNITGALTLADAINPSVPRGANWIRHRLTAANRDAAGNTINWSRRIIYGDRFVQAALRRAALVPLGRRSRLGLRLLSSGIDWANQAGDNIVWGNDDNIVWGNGDNIVWGNDDNIVWGNQADDNIVWGNDESDNIVWGIDDNIVWGNADNIVWGNSDDDNIVWGNSHLRDVWASNVLSGFWDDNIVWGNITRAAMDNIVWGNADDNIVLAATTSSGATAVAWRQHRVGQCSADGRETLMEKMPYQPELERAATMATPSTATTSRLAREPAGADGSELHAPRAARRGCAVAAGDADHRRSVAIHFAAADHGRRLRAVHRLDAARARAGQLRLLRRRAGGHDHRDRDLPAALARARLRIVRVGLRARLAVLGHGPVRRRRDGWC